MVDILDEDTYNIDEKRFMMGVAGSAEVVFSKYEKQVFVKQGDDGEWASLIEAVGLRRQLPMWCIFKGEKFMDEWYNALESGQEYTLLSRSNQLCRQLLNLARIPWIYHSLYEISYSGKVYGIARCSREL